MIDVAGFVPRRISLKRQPQMWHVAEMDDVAGFVSRRSSLKLQLFLLLHVGLPLALGCESLNEWLTFQSTQFGHNLFRTSVGIWQLWLQRSGALRSVLCCCALCSYGLNGLSNCGASVLWHMCLFIMSLSAQAQSTSLWNRS